MSTSLPRILVLTLFCGEAEYERCKLSVSQQEGVSTEHVCFEWLPNLEAHEALYRTILSRAGEFDAFLKLDADMVLVHERALLEAWQIFVDVPDTDHLSIPVYDHPSGSYLMGFHLFSPRVSWSFPLDPLFPDSNPNVPGFERIDFGIQRRLIDHMPSPSKEQAFALGVHRASKIVQPGRGKNRRPADFPLSYLKRVARNRTFDPELRHLILSGMFQTLLALQADRRYKGEDRKIEAAPLARLLASGFARPPLTDIVFQFLRLRYVHWRRLSRLEQP